LQSSKLTVQQSQSKRTSSATIQRENDLQGVIEEYGKVDSCKIIKDRETGKSKGFAFVEMPDDADATKVIEELNGAEFDGRTMVVKEARPRA
jgi:RNA recognition motif-containing protein